MADTRAPRRTASSARKPPKTSGAASPPNEAPAPAASPPTSAPGQGNKVLQKKLERMIVSFGLPFAAAGDMGCARNFATRGPIVAEAWANLAAESPAVKERLEAMLKGGAWTGAIGATFGLLMPVAIHHGAPVPPLVAGLFGASPPEPRTVPEPEPTPAPGPPREPFSAPGNGVPGPAAYSAPRTDGGSVNGADPHDPAAYPGS